MTDQKNVIIFAEQQHDKIQAISYELLSKGKEIAEKTGAELFAVLLGEQMDEEAKELIYYGADKVFLYQHSSFKDFDPLNYKLNIVNLVQEQKPALLLLGASHLGRSLAPRLAVALKTGLSADCIGLEVDDEGNIIQIRPAFSGSVLAYIKTKTKPVIATLRYKSSQSRERDSSRKGEIINREAEISPPLLTILRKQKSGEVNLTEADIIISGGRGLKKAADISILSGLAETCGGVIGVSRPLVDDGWIGKEHQVGFSGNTVKPKVYIACGISGSSQHLAGMRRSDIIMAINTDPSAPIFKVADYGIVGDLYEIVPKLINEIKGRTS
jgi:electron transfer flavoprotein alpha subunit